MTKCEGPAPAPAPAPAPRAHGAGHWRPTPPPSTNSHGASQAPAGFGWGPRAASHLAPAFPMPSGVLRAHHRWGRPGPPPPGLARQSQPRTCSPGGPGEPAPGPGGAMLTGWWLAPLPAPRQAHHRPGACTAAAWPPLLPTYRGSQSQRRAGALGGLMRGRASWGGAGVSCVRICPQGSTGRRPCSGSPWSATVCSVCSSPSCSSESPSGGRPLPSRQLRAGGARSSHPLPARERR